jgi:hypothetical protein
MGKKDKKKHKKHKHKKDRDRDRSTSRAPSGIDPSAKEHLETLQEAAGVTDDHQLQDYMAEEMEVLRKY